MTNDFLESYYIHYSACLSRQKCGRNSQRLYITCVTNKSEWNPRVEGFQRTSALCIDALYERIRPASKATAMKHQERHEQATLRLIIHGNTFLSVTKWMVSKGGLQKPGICRCLICILWLLMFSPIIFLLPKYSL